MKPIKPWRLATLLALSTLTACASGSAPVSSDVTQLQAEAADAKIEEFCRGQVPRSLDTIAWCDGPRDAEGQCLGVIVDGVTIMDYRAGPEWARTYVISNDEQWARPCEEIVGR